MEACSTSSNQIWEYEKYIIIIVIKFLKFNWSFSKLIANSSSVKKRRKPTINNTYEINPILSPKSTNKLATSMLCEVRMPPMNRKYVNRKYSKSITTLRLLNLLKFNRYYL
ncbi:hypothetical protein HZR23_06910 [Serpentinicella alkaliphila]|uniref:hypothetical protein n=1 Tax=Serpentinicella alkaliphila TaxID=1734049 RepID=UPI001BC85EAE|nr:hypothetical protein [Serpentinicella alkaliphila]QUH25518.1 hypothetical protein HZR23_06910 [Serpentinicella alkaliphila]